MKVLKKILITAAVAVTMLMPVSLSASAERMMPLRVIDNADLLTDEQEKSLSDKIDNIIEKHEFDVVILTEESIDGYSPMAYADDYYDYNGYGMGEDGDGVLLLLSMEERDWWISTKGYGIDVFTDSKIDQMGNIIVPSLSSGDYNEAFELFVSNTEKFISSKKLMSILISVGIGLGIGLVVALIVVLVFKSQLKSVKFEYAAREYEDKSSFNVTRSNDVFLYRNVTKQKKPESSGGGSSTHISSSGSSHGGGGGKF